ncbi:hypothetical protein FGIG_08123 [Fasciola gigantica]|uniref:Uncharacterized protein n=1 Tax=Fasciola gigantica TaxID=46835 RepID=A0A504YE06_FASGI|nr:hypothetical protein FGIG_08123 [Fasciola gigantica]
MLALEINKNQANKIVLHVRSETDFTASHAEASRWFLVPEYRV